MYLEMTRPLVVEPARALGLLMAEDGRNALVWWDREFDSSGRHIRADVRAAAHEIWPNACRHTQAILHDAGDAAELMEQAVAQVSQYLDRASADPYSQNTTGILMCAFCRALRRYAMKLNRLQCVGRSVELPERVLAPRWPALLELRIDLAKLGCRLTEKARTMLGLRSRGYDWNEIANVLHTTETAARTAFWREIKRARSKEPAKGDGHEPHDDC